MWIQQDELKHMNTNIFHPFAKKKKIFRMISADIRDPSHSKTKTNSTNFPKKLKLNLKTKSKKKSCQNVQI